jgi:DNA-directed RNA polymerase specialized sigma24 family protein
MSEDVNSIDDALRGIEPRLKELLAKYRIPAEDVEDLLQQTFLSLLSHCDRVDDPKDWFLSRLELECASYWRGKPDKPEVTE